MKRTFFAVACLLPALATTQPLDGDGLSLDKPRCDMAFLVRDSLRDEVNLLPTGEKAKVGGWNAEIVANSTGVWFLLGSQDAKADDTADLCYLGKGRGPYRETAWFKRYFRK